MPASEYYDRKLFKKERKEYGDLLKNKNTKHNDKSLDSKDLSILVKNWLKNPNNHITNLDLIVKQDY